MSTLIVIASASCVAALLTVAAELAARAWIRRRGGWYVWAPWHRTQLHVDLDALPSLEPVTRFEINGDGERGDPLPRDRRGMYRVLVAGGSAAEGWFLDQRSSWPGVLQELLNSAAIRAQLGARFVHVGSIARSLVPCAAIQRMLAQSLRRYDRLDLVLFMVGASDVVAWLERGTPPAIEDDATPIEWIFDEHPSLCFTWSPSQLALKRLVSRLHRRLLEPVRVRERAGARFVELRRRRARALQWIDDVPDPEPMLACFELHLRRMIATARAKRARVIVVRQPWFEKDFTPEEEAAMWNFCVGRPYEEPTTRYYTHAVVADLMRKVDDRAAAVCRELDVEHVDLMPVLERSLTTYYDFLHFTPLGARAVAEEIASAVCGAAVPTAATRSR